MCTIEALLIKLDGTYELSQRPPTLTTPLAAACAAIWSHSPPSQAMPGPDH